VSEEGVLMTDGQAVLMNKLIFVLAELLERTWGSWRRGARRTVVLPGGPRGETG